MKPLSQRRIGGAALPRLLRCVVGSILVLAGGFVAGGCGEGGSSPTTGSTVSLQPHTQAAVRHVQQHPGESIVATATTHSVPIYRSPSARHPFARLSNPTSVGAPLVFLVKSRARTWERVYLPIRPDGSTGWVSDRDVSLAWNPYSLLARLARHQLILRTDGRVTARFPAAVGRSVLPTPTGRYYLVELLKQPNPNGPYGPYAFGTSAFSKVLYHFGGGPGQIGIHGTNEHGSIGQSVSHGCIRLRNHDIVRLAHLLPLGTPITILR
jgi:L,D-transpeptidase catalytic domain